MFYKFNAIAGRISPSTYNYSYVPQGLRPFEDRPTIFQFDQQSTRAVSVPETNAMQGIGRVPGQPANMSTVATGKKPLGFIPTDPKYAKIMEMQKLFTKDDGVLVWLKKGPKDKYLFYITAGLCAAGVVASFHTLYKMSFPQKK